MPVATHARPTESLYFSTVVPPQLATLNLPDTQLYLQRLGLDPELAHSPPSVELLSALLLNHHLKIPYDSSNIHVADWTGPSRPIEWRKGPGMELGRKNFERIVGTGKDRKQVLGLNGLPRGGGGYCFSLNQSFTALLRGFGFFVSELPARVFKHRGRDPATSGYWWSHNTHSALLVDWPGSERYFLDVGFGGGGSPILIPFHDGATGASLSKSESFLIRFETMPVGDLTTYPDPPDGFTLYRRVVDEGVEINDHCVAESVPGYWTPCIHCSVASMSPEDITMADFFNSCHPDAPWASIFLVSILLPNGARRTLCHGVPAIDRAAPPHPEGKKLAKLYSKEGIKGSEFDIEWIAFETGPIREVLEKEFNFRF
ncbi:uncharacterized protein JCM6883_002830 [Sporobolomyces salmoneus]|uniref:uncharacterized protein n=1 Tax=Sporobolomyces salmoneus TaxID=183962 RepID=UPI003175195F